MSKRQNHFLVRGTPGSFVDTTANPVLAGWRINPLVVHCFGEHVSQVKFDFLFPQTMRQPWQTRKL
ncbi:hypothetical protein RMSM_00142 [Rhodopirellula maiorica SM1]|uniref:Uncharacterized protein n=1 Tax=Rhodopirellula maiorica SM1 TaxID=1265738 RepID=M5RUC1_9BACT|nr:hypothetical protein RMSM_00142 [Rhodopirellula maiorica SM1]